MSAEQKPVIVPKSVLVLIGTIDAVLVNHPRPLPVELLEDCKAELLRLAETNARLRQYAKHLASCDKQQQMPTESNRVYMFPNDWELWVAKQKCTCGLEALLASESRGGGKENNT